MSQSNAVKPRTCRTCRETFTLTANAMREHARTCGTPAPIVVNAPRPSSALMRLAATAAALAPERVALVKP